MYYKQLDSLRAFAVFMVIIFHWSPNGHHFLFPIGSFGVELFFVISGFLITKILLESRLSAEKAGRKKTGVLKNFILRRSLRIFPLYYLALVIILIFDRTNVSGLKDNFSYFFGYASNFYFFKQQYFSFPMAHLWSLAVEEQFYMFWPWFILFLLKKFLKKFLYISIVAGIISRFILGSVFASAQVPIDILTPACIDCFAIGGLFSYYLIFQKDNYEKIFSFINLSGIISFMFVFIILFFKIDNFSFFLRTLDSFFCLALVANTYRGFKGITGKIAENKMLIYLGKISYGLYIYHLLTPWLTMIFLNVLSRFKSSFIQSFAEYYHSGFYIKFTIDSLVLILVASISWEYFEKPINKYKYLFSDKGLAISKKNLISNPAL